MSNKMRFKSINRSCKDGRNYECYKKKWSKSKNPKRLGHEDKNGNKKK